MIIVFPFTKVLPALINNCITGNIQKSCLILIRIFFLHVIYVDFLLCQSWNRYSPLPQPAQTGFGTESPSPLSSSSLTEPKTVIDVDPYNNLPQDSKRVVDTVASMGFSKASAARAVEKLGADQKEVLYMAFVNPILNVTLYLGNRTVLHFVTWNAHAIMW